MGWRISVGFNLPYPGLGRMIEMHRMKCSPVTFHPREVFNTESLGVDEQSVHIEIKCHSGLSDPYVALGGHFVGVKTLRGRSECQPFCQYTRSIYLVPFYCRLTVIHSNT
jgi:hypothetical protein